MNLDGVYCSRIGIFIKECGMKFSKMLCISLFLVSFLIACGGGGGGGSVDVQSTQSGTTAIDPWDARTLNGTYQFTFFELDCTNGQTIGTNDFDQFTGYFGYDGTYNYTRLYVVYDGEVIANESSKELVTDDEMSINWSADQLNDYEVKFYIYNEYMGSGVYCDIEANIKKLTDSIDATYLGSVARSKDKDEVVDDLVNTKNLMKLGYLKQILINR